MSDGWALTGRGHPHPGSLQEPILKSRLFRISFHCFWKSHTSLTELHVISHEVTKEIYISSCIFSHWFTWLMRLQADRRNPMCSPTPPNLMLLKSKPLLSLTQPGETASSLVPLIPLLSQTQSVWSLHRNQMIFSKLKPGHIISCLKLCYFLRIQTDSNHHLKKVPRDLAPMHLSTLIVHSLTCSDHMVFCLLNTPSSGLCTGCTTCLETLFLHLHRADSCISKWSQLKVHLLRAAGADHLL